MPSIPWALAPDRCFGEDPARRQIARDLYTSVKDQPILSPHGHVPPALLAGPTARLGTPAELFIIPDHYVFRMLYSQGVPLEDLGVPRNHNTSLLRRFGADKGAPSRHDVWRRVSCDWLAGLVMQGLIAEDETAEMAYECAYGLAKRAYRVEA